MQMHTVASNSKHRTAPEAHAATTLRAKYSRLGTVAACGAVLALLPFIGMPRFYVELFTQAWVMSVAAIGLDLLLGYTGLVSFTHGAIFGVGAYAVAIAATRYGIEGFFWGLLIGVAAAALVSLVFAFVSLRTLGASFIIITLALNQLIWGTAQQWTSLTGGDNGLVGFGRPSFLGLSLDSPTSYYLFTLAVLIAVIAVMRMVVRSAFGQTLIGVRDQPERMEALGYNPWLHRMIVFVVGGTLAGFAGVLFAYYNLFVSPEQLHVGLSVNFLLIVILGGRATIYGSVVGALIIIALGNYLSNFTDRWQIILGALYVLIVLYARRGVAGFGSGLVSWVRGRRGPRAEAPGEAS